MKFALYLRSPPRLYANASAGLGVLQSERMQAHIVRAMACVFACLMAQPAPAQNVPLPPKRPPNLSPIAPPQNEAPDSTAIKASPAADPSVQAHQDCTSGLVSLGLITETVPKPAGVNSACQVSNPVRISAMRFKDRTVSFPDRPVLDCRAAQAVGLWLRDIVLPLTEIQLGSPVSAFETGPGFECRNRNRATTGKLSAHASGLAIDVARIRLADKSALVVQKPEGNAQIQLLNTLRQSACGWFTTVLGPGSDAAHSDHLHLDVELRGASGTGRYCH